MNGMSYGFGVTAALLLAGAAGAQEAAEAAAAQVADETARLEEVVTTGRSLSGAAQLVNERLDDAVVVDVLSSEAISRLGDSTVADALVRMPGMTLIDDKFVYIRGLGERYSASSLNGARIPSPDLTRNVIPLDIFPTSVVDAILVQKAYSPDLPANFGGGSVEIRTKGIPSAFTLEFEGGIGSNSQVDGSVLSYPGGGDDRYGTDDGARALPEELLEQINRFQGNVDVQGILAGLQAEDPSLSSDEALQQARALNRAMGLSLNRQIGLEQRDPNADINVKAAVGNTLDVSPDLQFGYLVGASYDSSWRETERVSRNFQFPEERVDTETESTRNVNLHGNLNLGLTFLGEHDIATTTLYLRNTDDETAINDFFNENRELSDGIGFRNYRLEFEERNLMVNQITGEHYIGDATREFLPEGLVRLVEWVPADAELSWFYSDASARTQIPNRVEVAAQTVTDPVTGVVQESAVTLDATAADFRFTDLDDQVENYGWSATYPISIGNSAVEVGFGYQHDRKSRTYRQSQFSLGPLDVGDISILRGPLDSVFSDANIGNPANNFVFDIQGTNNQSYIAATMTNAAYGKIDWTWKDTWRFAGGARWEYYRQAAVDWNPFGFSASDPQVTTDVDTLVGGTFESDELYPAAAVTYMTRWWAETFQLRFGYSETSVRPDLREITDASYVDPRTGDLVDGNPGVVPAEVTNFDIRGEWFFKGGDNLTATLFYKDIANPIEFFESAASDTTTAREIINADSAEVYGIEIEGLKRLRFLGLAFEPFFVQGNLTLQDSELVAGSQADAPTNPVRSLTGSSEYVTNLALGYDSLNGQHTASLAYNVFGERLYVAGRNGAPDGFEQPFHSLDFTYSWYPTHRITVKAKLRNILGEKIEIDREGVLSFVEDPGSSYSLSFRLAL